MKKLFMDWAGSYDVLTRAEELEVIGKNRDDDKTLLEVLLRHNAKYLLKYAYKWRGTYETDDALGIIVEALTRNFHTWDHKSSFVYYAKYIIISAMHRNIPKVFEELQDYDCIDETCKDYTDLREELEGDLHLLLDDSEVKFITDIYFNGLTIKDAGDNIGLTADPSKSRKHCKILAKLSQELSSKYGGEIT